MSNNSIQWTALRAAAGRYTTFMPEPKMIGGVHSMHMQSITVGSMGKTSQISARINSQDKERAERVFKKLGVTASQAITMFYKQVHLRRGIPFSLEIPNEVTVKAIEESRAGKGKSYDSVEALMDDLG